jgi:hypothetical protein
VNGEKFQLDPLDLSMALRWNLIAEVGERLKNSVYPMYRPAPSEYCSIALQQYKLLRLAVGSLGDLSCVVFSKDKF